MHNTHTTDILILGGGIAGLWLLNRLRNEGYDATLLENDALGAGQTIVSQGMIHGGIKYALSGNLTSAANAIADMPAHWKACLKGQGDVDLRGTNLLSEQYYMWPKSSVRSRLNAFLGSKALRGKVNAVKKEDYPKIFQGSIDGPLYQLNDIVLDVPSLLHTLSEKHRDHIRKIDWQQSRLEKNPQGGILHLLIEGKEPITIDAQRYVFTSGAGTEQLLKNFELAQNSSTAMQLRPLQMTVLKHASAKPVYVHCVADQLTTTPEVTITSHLCKDGQWAWYLGGEIAESGADRSQEQQINAAKQKINDLFPWCDFSNAQWHSFYIDRAEAKQKDGKRPENPSLICHDNIMVGWPSKLTLAPGLSNDVLATLQQQKITPLANSHNINLEHLPFPGIASTPWDDM